MEDVDIISVIITVYNIEHYLPRCLETIAAQTYKNLEIIIVDDGSTDSSGVICDNFAMSDGRAKVIHQHNKGPWAARNLGLRAVHGNYVMFVDGDDYLHIDAIRVMYESINQNGGYDMSMIDRKYTILQNENIEEKGENSITEMSQAEVINNLFKHQDKVLFVYLWNKLYRRGIIESICFNEYMRSEDLDFNLRVFMKVNRVIWVHRQLYFYFQRSESLVKTANSWEVYYRCQTDILYQNFITLPADKQQYAHLLLVGLYRTMAEMKYLYHKGNKRKEVYSICRKYKQDTCKAYWLSSNINFTEKVIWTLLFYSPLLMGCGLKMRSILVKIGVKH